MFKLFWSTFHLLYSLHYLKEHIYKAAAHSKKSSVEEKQNSFPHPYVRESHILQLGFISTDEGGFFSLINMHQNKAISFQK